MIRTCEPGNRGQNEPTQQSESVSHNYISMIYNTKLHFKKSPRYRLPCRPLAHAMASIHWASCQNFCACDHPKHRQLLQRNDLHSHFVTGCLTGYSIYGPTPDCSRALIQKKCHTKQIIPNLHCSYEIKIPVSPSKIRTQG